MFASGRLSSAVKSSRKGVGRLRGEKPFAKDLIKGSTGTRREGVTASW